MRIDRLCRAFAPESDYEDDLKRTTSPEELARILAKPEYMWTYTEVLRAMNSESYFISRHPQFESIRDRVMGWFQYAYPGSVDLSAGQRSTVSSSYYSEGRRAEDEILARRAAAQLLQSYGRHGDTVLAHLTPGEAMLLHLATDGGSINPDTGLLEFWEGEDKKEGTYIWRTVGDSKVRDAHAERDGKEFSWDDPPEGGHPGEAPNCRCWAEEPNCTIEWLELRKIVEELVPLDAKLSELKRKIHNKKLDIEIDEADIEICEAVNTAAKYGKLLKLIPHPAGRFAGWAFALGETISAGVLMEIKASLEKNKSELAKLEAELPALEKRVQSLKEREKVAIRAYNECKGIKN